MSELIASFFKGLITNDNPIVGLLSVIVLALTAVVVYQWKYTMSKTVPKWIWDNMIVKLDQILDVQQRLGTIVDERLKK